MPGASVAVGRSVEDAKDRLEEIVAGCASVDLVVNGGQRAEAIPPEAEAIVWLTSTTNITRRTARGGLGTESFDLQFLIEVSRKWVRVEAGADVETRQAAADDLAERDVRARRWTVADEIAAKLEANPGTLGTSSATLVVSSEQKAFVDGYWVARVTGYVQCSKFRANG